MAEAPCPAQTMQVTFIQKRLLLQKRRRSRAERQVRVMPVILSSGHGGQSEEEDITGPTMSAAILNSVLVRSVEEVEAVEDKQAEESFMGPSDSLVDLVDSNLTDSINPEGVEQMSSFPAEMSIGSFEGSVDVDMLASVGAPREESVQALGPPFRKKAGTMHGWFSSLWRSTKVQDAPASSQSLKGHSMLKRFILDADTKQTAQPLRMHS
eukprot:g31353.t1